MAGWKISGHDRNRAQRRGHIRPLPLRQVHISASVWGADHDGDRGVLRQETVHRYGLPVALSGRAGVRVLLIKELLTLTPLVGRYVAEDEFDVSSASSECGPSALIAVLSVAHVGVSYFLYVSTIRHDTRMLKKKPCRFPHTVYQEFLGLTLVAASPAGHAGATACSLRSSG